MNTTISTSYLKEHTPMEVEPSWPHTVAVLVDGANESTAQFNPRKIYTRLNSRGAMMRKC